MIDFEAVSEVTGLSESTGHCGKGFDTIKLRYRYKRNHQEVILNRRNRQLSRIQHRPTKVIFCVRA